MKCLCFSDSHGSSELMRRALNMHRDTEAVFFLGDGLSDLAEIAVAFPMIMFYSVRGNCDFSSAYSGVPKSDLVTLLGKKIFNRLNAKLLKKCVYGMMAISGVINIVTSLI